jgi:flagellar hook assembly protein FlgD
MKILRSLLAIAVVLAVAATVSAADAQKKAAKKGAAVKGAVVSVEKDQDKNTGTVTVTVQPPKKDVNAKPEDKKFKITEATKIEKIVGGNIKTGEAKAATIADLVKGARVQMTVKDDTVESIKFVEGKKKK